MYVASQQDNEHVPDVKMIHCSTVAIHFDYYKMVSFAICFILSTQILHNLLSYT